MGKKVKLGKQRKDKFYHLAKDAGYRARSAFKLIQLNRKFEFLQRARVLIDLCAAPGGWLQVAQQNMPVSSLIVGVDLVPIKAIPKVITLQEDITTAKCRQNLKRQLMTWKADVVLHDGAPNVGKSWDHDAFAQAQLTLHALKLASEMLMKGGWFITKVFRSKDYNALLWVFKKLFKKVHATKPQASRNESAEIFVVCQHFIAPDKIDPKFLDPAHVFQDVEPETKVKLNLFKPDSKPQKAKAEGYADGKATTENKILATEFINGNHHLELLATGTEIILDDPVIASHKFTDKEIVECCKDLKVLGKGELKNLLNWKRKMKIYLDKNKKKLAPTDIKDDGVEEEVAMETENIEIEESNKEEEEGAEKLRFEKEILQEEKRKKKKVLKEKRKLQAKTDLKMVIKNDEPIAQEDQELFQLAKLRRKKDIIGLDDQDPNVLSAKELDEDEEDEGISIKKKKTASYNRNELEEEWNAFNSKATGSDQEFSDSEIEFSEDDEEDLDFEEPEDNENEEKNPLMVSLLDEVESSKSRKAQMWFDKDSFMKAENDSDEELELNLADEIHKQNISKTNGKVYTSDGEDEEEEIKAIIPEAATVSDEDTSSDDDDNEIPIPRKKKKRIRLDPQGLALGTMMIKSNKAKRDILDAAHNRYTFNDDNLPDWFTQDEEKHSKQQIPVSAEMIQDYKAQLREINARPIKKVAEAKARKKKREIKKLDRARKKAEAVTENPDMSSHEKAQHIKTIYKKAMADKKDKNVTYVFPKKGVGKRVRRPQGVKGKFKVVDKRMKKDNRRQKTADKPKKSNRRKKRKA